MSVYIFLADFNAADENYQEGVLMQEHNLIISFRLWILSALIINQLHIIQHSIFFSLSYFVGKRDLWSNNGVSDTCTKDHCPVSPPTSVPGEFYD